MLTFPVPAMATTPLQGFRAEKLRREVHGYRDREGAWRLVDLRRPVNWEVETTAMDWVERVRERDRG